jgi:chitinase
MQRLVFSSLALIVGCGSAGFPDEEASGVVASDIATATTYRFETLVAANKCMNVTGAASSDGTKIQEFTCDGTAAEAFRVDDLGGGSVKLVNPATGKCVDIAGAGTADGTQVQLWTCNGTAAQSFRVNDAGSGRVTITNPSSGKCIDVSGGGTANGTKIQLWTCNQTNAQYWKPVIAAPPSTTPGLPAKVVAGYYPNWTPSPVRIKDVNANYNVIYLFAAKPVGGAPGTTGAVTWAMPGDGRGAASNFNADIRYARTTQGRKIILSVGGAGAGMSFPTRSKSQTFVNSVVGIYNQLGGFDGMDWNTFEGSQSPDTAEMIWISQELKRLYPGFIISAPPAPWNGVDKTFCKAMVDAGALDYAAPQYYDGPGLDLQSYIVNSVNEWSSLLGASKVVVGFGIWDQPNYMSVGEAVPTWRQVETNLPSIRGAFDWQIHTDEAQGWPFANQVGPLVLQ